MELTQTPQPHVHEYTSAIHLTATTTLKFIGYDNFDNAGTPGEETYTLDDTGPTVTANPTSTAFGPTLGLDVELILTILILLQYSTQHDGTDPDTSATRTRIHKCYTSHSNYHTQVHWI